jgi:hypothetical protein
LIYDYDPDSKPSSANLKAVSAEVRNALAPFDQKNG